VAPVSRNECAGLVKSRADGAFGRRQSGAIEGEFGRTAATGHPRCDVVILSGCAIKVGAKPGEVPSMTALPTGSSTASICLLTAACLHRSRHSIIPMGCLPTHGCED
jgi:hypothetical protein